MTVTQAICCLCAISTLHTQVAVLSWTVGDGFENWVFFFSSTMVVAVSANSRTLRKRIDSLSLYISGNAKEERSDSKFPSEFFQYCNTQFAPLCGEHYSGSTSATEPYRVYVELLVCRIYKTDKSESFSYMGSHTFCMQNQTIITIFGRQHIGVVSSSTTILLAIKVHCPLYWTIKNNTYREYLTFSPHSNFLWSVEYFSWWALPPHSRCLNPKECGIMHAVWHPPRRCCQRALHHSATQLDLVFSSRLFRDFPCVHICWVTNHFRPENFEKRRGHRCFSTKFHSICTPEHRGAQTFVNEGIFVNEKIEGEAAIVPLLPDSIHFLRMADNAVQVQEFSWGRAFSS